ncbi:ComEA family DNA-binding protein [Singulisphaera rosea]
MSGRRPFGLIRGLSVRTWITRAGLARPGGPREPRRNVDRRRRFFERVGASSRLLREAVAAPLPQTASLAELQALPGIGKTLARRIVEGRPYGSVEELE